MSVVDVFDALTTARPYKRAFSLERAFEELRDEVARGWRNPEIVERRGSSGDPAGADAERGGSALLARR